MIRATAGRGAAAHDAFRTMVGVIERQERDYFWAGEYFERVGDWRTAVRYYRQGLVTDSRERGLNLTGLARSYARLGLPDSAAARRARARCGADRAGRGAADPVLLAAEERWAEAVAEAEAWVRRREEGGHVAGIAAKPWARMPQRR